MYINLKPIENTNWEDRLSCVYELILNIVAYNMYKVFAISNKVTNVTQSHQLSQQQLKCKVSKFYPLSSLSM